MSGYKETGGEIVISIGIDAHKKKCVATLKRDSKAILEQVTFQNRASGFAELLGCLRKYNESAVAVVESTANYWIRLHDTLEDNGIDCLLANPLQLKAIAKARLKDDKIDSNILADLLRGRLLMTIPGVDYLTALTIMSEIVYITRFSTPWKLVSYAGLAPSRRSSGDKKHSGGITRQGSRWLRFALVEAAGTTIRYDQRPGNFYSRISARRGPQKAKVAAAKEMLVIMWHMLTKNEPYRTQNHAMTETKYKIMERESRTV